MTPSEMLARTSAQREALGRAGADGLDGRAATLELVASVVGIGVRVGAGRRLQLVDHLVEVLAAVLAELLAHLAHPARHALRVALVDVAEDGVVGEVVEAVVLGADASRSAT